MRKIYVDSENKCHVTNPDGISQEIELDCFDDKCDAFIEGYCYEVKENSITIYPWKPYSELDAAQRDYERKLLAEYAEALRTVGVSV